MELVLLAGAVLALAWANGANDTGKPVASLAACGALAPRPALLVAAGAGLAGSIAAAWWAADLVRLFAGAGLVDEATRLSSVFAPAVAMGAAGAVLLASRLGLPVSTTHALLGAMLGAAPMLHGTIAWGAVATRMAGPLLLAPVAALLLSLCLGAVLRRWRARGGACLCAVRTATAAGPGDSVLVTGDAASCAGATRLATTAGLGRGAHLLTAVAIAGARGLQDAPKIAALLLPLAALSPALGGTAGTIAIGLAMAVGGWLAGGRVLEVMSTRLVEVRGREAEAGAANGAAATLILVASPLGMPVSTTHVTTGALVGAGVQGGGLS
jgi:PiT family inorganic phosphate transporter